MTTRPARPCLTGATPAAGSSLNATALLLLVGLLFVVLAGPSNSFVPRAVVTLRQPHHHSSSTSRLLALKRLEGESEKAYFQRVTAAASDPEAFQRLVVSSAGETKKASASAASDRKSKNNKNGSSSSGSDAADGEKQPRRKYVPVEEWEAEQQRKGKNGELSWEERVQFEGQRSGDRFKQNEILRHNLHAW